MRTNSLHGYQGYISQEDDGGNFGNLWNFSSFQRLTLDQFYLFATLVGFSCSYFSLLKAAYTFYSGQGDKIDVTTINPQKT